MQSELFQSRSRLLQSEIEGGLAVGLGVRGVGEVYPNQMIIACNVAIPPIARNEEVAPGAVALVLSPAKPGAAQIAILIVGVKHPPVLFGGGSAILNEISLHAHRHFALRKRAASH